MLKSPAREREGEGNAKKTALGFRRAVIIRRQCEGLIYLKEMGEEGRQKASRKCR